jgi:hypothetical protein
MGKLDDSLIGYIPTKISNVKCPRCPSMLTIVDGASGGHDCFLNYTEEDWKAIGWVELGK